MENLAKTVRRALGLNQSDFARELGVAIGTVQQYERGANIPAAREAQIRDLAAKSGVAMNLGEFEVKRVFHPGETIISSRKGRGGRHEEWHQKLEDILESGLVDAMEAVKSNLVCFHNYVAARGGASRAAAPAKRAKERN